MTSKGSKKATRKRTLLEVYSELYYKSKLQGLVSAAVQADPEYNSLPSAGRAARHMSLYHQIRADSWATESDDVKVVVQGIYDKEHQDKADEDIDKDDEDEDDEEVDEKKLLQRQQE
jgi:hypothetical protein